jgi:signal transduction histidine kinase
MKIGQFEDIKTCIGLDDRDAERLCRLGPLLQSEIPHIVETFYRLMLADPEAKATFTDEEQLDRQRAVIGQWMNELFQGSYDKQYFEHRCEIGRTHVRVHLPQRFMFSGMNVIRTQLSRAIQALDLPDCQDTIDSLNKLLDLELAIMLETYREHYVARIREADRNTMQQQMDEVQHMASLGQLAASLAHEIKNPLAGISGAIQIMSRDIGTEHRHHSVMSEILAQIDRLDSAVKDLLIYARPKPPELRSCDIGETIRSSLVVLREDPAIKTITIEYEGLERETNVMLDRRQFEQVISNLVLNAAQACNGVGIVTLRVNENPDTVTLAISDDGAGMSAEVVEKAMDPFFTTKARGTGLGLSICKRIVDAHRGELHLDTKPSQGTTVTISLPNVRSASKE